MRQALKKLIPVMIIIVLMIIFFSLDLGKYFTFQMLKEKHEYISGLVSDHPFTSALVFISLYIIAIALSLPIAGILSLGMGYLFPLPLSTLYVVVGATIGACLIFLAAKTALKAVLYERVKPFLSKIEKEMKKNGASYLLTLRLIPLIPFWLVNLAPAFLDVPLKTFAWTTFVGIIPGSFVFTQAGAGLSTILENNDHFSFRVLFTPQVQIAFAILIIFSIVPIVIKKVREKNHDR